MIGELTGQWPAPGVTFPRVACCHCLHLRAVFHAFKAPALAFLLLCPRPRVAQFQGAGTGCQTATAPHLAAHYTPLPREVSRQGRGLCSVGQYVGEVGLTLTLLSRTSNYSVVGRLFKTCFPENPKQWNSALYLTF